MKKRILFIATFPPPVHGSAVVSQQIKDSRLINDSFCCDYVNLSASRRVDEVGNQTLKNLFLKFFRLLSAFTKEFWLLLTRHYNLCYLAITCHGDGFIKDSPFLLLCKLFRRKIIIHHHNKGMADDVNRWPYRWLFPLCYKNAKVILLSWYLYSDIEKIVPKENVLICPNGIKFDSLGVFRKAKDNTIPHILFLSNLIESKGVFVLLDALKILEERGVPFVCNFVGGESRLIDAKRFAQEVEDRGLNRVVFYHGRKAGADKEEFFEDSDIFVLPTYNETFGIVNLEAMAHHLPVVTTNEGGIPDVVQNEVNGIICRKRDPLSLADSIERLLTDSSLRKVLGDAGYQILKEKFSEEVFINKMYSVLNEEASW